MNKLLLTTAVVLGLVSVAHADSNYDCGKGIHVTIFRSGSHSTGVTVEGEKSDEPYEHRMTWKGETMTFNGRTCKRLENSDD